MAEEPRNPADAMRGRDGSVFRSLLGQYPWQSAVLVVLLILAGLAEGFGLLTLLPLLQVAAGGELASGLVETTVLAVLELAGFAPTLPVLLTALVLALLAKGLFRWLAMRRVGYAVARVARDLRLRLVRGLLDARWDHHGADRSGELAAALGRDAFWAGYAYRHGLGAIAAGIQLVVYAGVVVLISWGVGALAAAAALLVALAFGGFVRMSRRAGAEQTRRARALVSRLLDVVGGMKAIKGMAREAGYQPVLVEETRALEAAERRQVFATESLRAFQEPLAALILAPLVYIGLTYADMAFATLLVMVFLVQRVLTRSHRAQAEYQGVVAAEAAFHAIHRQIVAAESRREREPTGDGRVGSEYAAPVLEDRLEVRDVSLSYDGRTVLDSVSLTIPARKITVLVGPSGVGKTTLLDLLLMLRRPDSGRILVDGVDLHDVDLPSWRRRIGYVPQDPVLIEGSVAENVAFGEPVDPADVEQALRRAGAWSFVDALPHGTETVVGERGSRLSGGERQRVAVARALLRDPTLLVLDEATSELDEPAEVALIETLRELSSDMTIVAASHRTALADASDVRYELVAGTARYVGRPQEGTATGPPRTPGSR